MRILRDKEEVNESGKPRKWIDKLKWVGLKANKPKKVISYKDVVIGSRKSKVSSKKLMAVKEVKMK